MDPISKAGLLQKLFGSTANQQTGKPQASIAQSNSGSRAAPRPAASLPQKIAQGLSAIDAASPDATDRALAFVVRTMLTEEFGPAFTSDPAFANLHADVTDAIRQSDQYEQFARYLDTQLANSHQPKS